MGLDKKLASSRVNRYENETSGIDLDGLGKLADTLGVPMAYLVAEDDATAAVVLALSELSVEDRPRWQRRLFMVCKMMADSFHVLKVAVAWC